jgi:two-component system, OmpR family, sensor histidine kinase KdpD
VETNIFKKILPYGIIILLVGISAGILFPFRPWLHSTTVALVLLIPVVICTTKWGFGPGILSAILTFLIYNFLFLTPYYTFTVHDPQDIVALGMFLVIAVLISQLVGQSKRSLDTAVAREQELYRLYELSMSLTGVNHPKEVVDVLTHKVSQTIPSCSVEVIVPENKNEKEIRGYQNNSRGEIQPQPFVVFPLKTGRGAIGEIRIWKNNFPLTPPETRLMQAFSAQGALALERAFLAQAESRSKILEESDRLKSALLSSVSHELRTPLATIKAFVTSLLSDQISWDTVERKELLLAMNEETDHLNLLVGNLLDMSRIEAGAMKPNRKWNQLSEIVEAVVKRLSNGLTDNHVILDIPEDLPLVPVDYMQIDQVFTNLLSNSAKYSSTGSTIQVQARERTQEKELMVQVINQGPCLAEEHLDQIFSKFFRVTQTEKVSGTGLGLSICKGIIEAHGGRIWAENLPNGLAFKFTLPLLVEGMVPPVIGGENL